MRFKQIIPPPPFPGYFFGVEPRRAAAIATCTVKFCAALYTDNPASPSTTVSCIFGRSPAFHSGTSWRTR